MMLALPEPDWVLPLKSRTLRGLLNQAAFHRRLRMDGWWWYSASATAGASVLAGGLAWVQWENPIAAAGAVISPPALLWITTSLACLRSPYPLWTPYCRHEAEPGTVGFYIQRIGRHHYGTPLCQVVTPQTKTTWSLHPSFRRFDRPLLIDTGDYPTAGLGWLYPDHFDDAPPLVDGECTVRWRVDVTGSHEPILVATRSFTIRGGQCRP